MDEGGQAEAVAAGDAVLQTAQRRRHLRGRHDPAAERPGELAEPVLEIEVDLTHLREHLVLHRGDVRSLGTVGDVQPQADQLGQLLVQGHVLDDRGDVVRSNECGRGNQAGFFSGVRGQGRRGAVHPLTAPSMIPATSCFPATRKSSRSGTVAITDAVMTTE